MQENQQEFPREPGPFLKLTALLLLCGSILWIRGVFLSNSKIDSNLSGPASVAGPLSLFLTPPPGPFMVSEPGKFTLGLELRDCGPKNGKFPLAENNLILITAAERARLLSKSSVEPWMKKIRLLAIEQNKLIPLAWGETTESPGRDQGARQQTSTPSAKPEFNQLTAQLDSLALPFAREGRCLYLGIALDEVSESGDLELITGLADWCALNNSALLVLTPKNETLPQIMQLELQGRLLLLRVSREKSGAGAESSIIRDLKEFEAFTKGSSASAASLELTFSDMLEPLDVTGVSWISFGRKIILKTGPIPLNCSRSIVIRGNCGSSIAGRFPVMTIKTSVQVPGKVYSSGTSVMMNFQEKKENTSTPAEKKEDARDNWNFLANCRELFQSSGETLEASCLDFLQTQENPESEQNGTPAFERLLWALRSRGLPWSIKPQK